NRKLVTLLFLFILPSLSIVASERLLQGTLHISRKSLHVDFTQEGINELQFRIIGDGLLANKLRKSFNDVQSRSVLETSVNNQ
ncbi:MAG: hypothetical protein MHMPM18_003921, partial [Marteilia pararefringens]